MTVYFVTSYFNPIGYLTRERNYVAFRQNMRLLGCPVIGVQQAIDGRRTVESEVSVEGGAVVWQKEALLQIGVDLAIQQGAERIVLIDCDALLRSKEDVRRIELDFDRFDCFQPFDEIELKYSDTSVIRRGVMSQDSGLVSLSSRHPGGAFAATSDFFQHVSLYKFCLLGGGDTVLTSVFEAARRSGSDSAKFLGLLDYLCARVLYPGLRDSIVSWVANSRPNIWSSGFTQGVRLVCLPHGASMARHYLDRYAPWRASNSGPTPNIDFNVGGKRSTQMEQCPAVLATACGRISRFPQGRRIELLRGSESSRRRMTRKKVVFIGLDAADPTLIARWADQGLLPTFASLRAEWASVTVRTPPGLYVGALWPTFFTAVSPSEHGRYCWRQLRPRTYRDEFTTPDQVRGEPLWDVLGASGVRSHVLDIPKSSANGRHPLVTLVKDWGTHDPGFGGLQMVGRISRDRWVGRYGQDPVGRCDVYGKSKTQMGLLQSRLLARIELKEAMVREAIDDSNYDFLCAAFSEAHCVGHCCWHVHDHRHPWHSISDAAHLGDPLLDVYRALDGAIGRVLRSCHKDTAALVWASHGMGPHYSAVEIMPTVLMNIESALFGGESCAASSAPRDVSFGEVATYRRRSRLFVVPNNQAYLGLRANLKGREPDGLVEPSELADVLRRTVDALLAIMSDAGQPIFAEAIVSSEVYRRTVDDGLPDLLLKWSRTNPIEWLQSPLVPRLPYCYRGARSGDHSDGGLLFSNFIDERLAGRHSEILVTDIAPAIAGLYGVAFPTAMN